MTREELKTILASKENKLAKDLIEAIQTGKPLDTVKTLVAAGAADKHFQRDPSHPRSKYLVKHVLDTCFDCHFGIQEEKSEQVNGMEIHTMAIGHIPAAPGREEYFEALLEAGFTPGSNGYRGELMHAIIQGVFYNNDQERETARKLAEVAIAHGKINIQHFAETSYAWTGSLEKLERVTALGAEPNDKMMEVAMRYARCACNPGDPPDGRAAVIAALAAKGCKSQKMFELWTWIEEHNLDQTVWPEVAEKRKAHALRNIPGTQQDKERTWEEAQKLHAKTPTWKLTKELEKNQEKQITLLRVAAAARAYQGE
jgi:hypothetical protein